MSLLTFDGSSENDLRIIEWIADRQDPLGQMATHWFRVMRTTGPGITELLHDGYPTVCLGDYPFAYVGMFKKHINVGFFYGTSLADPHRMLEGSGKRMRHTKISMDKSVNEAGLTELIQVAYDDIMQRIPTS